ncbi:MAG TPA: TetR/AcrR family transcriptional regulator [Spirochaetota bacterium]|nr:TetR/AcrR family transcriptional regulator [Spirochaetota bacterium]
MEKNDVHDVKQISFFSCFFILLRHHDFLFKTNFSDNRMSEKTTLQTLKFREREARVNLIMDAAERVFATKSFDKASIREIAKEAGMAPSSIYRYFPNQEALFTEIVLKNQVELNKKLDDVITTGNPGNRIKNAVNTFIDFISQNDSYFRMMTIIMSQGNLSSDSSKKIIPIMNQTLDVLEKTVASVHIHEDSRTVARFIFAFLTGLVVAFNKLPGYNQKRINTLMKEIGTVPDILLNR